MIFLVEPTNAMLQNALVADCETKEPDCSGDRCMAADAW